VIPKFVGHVIELHPLAIIFAVICGEVLAGALGMLIAIPAAAAIKLVLDVAYPAPSTGDHAQSVHVDSNMFRPPDARDPEQIIAELKEIHDSEEQPDGATLKLTDPDSVRS
jgi:hypothetical protein